MTENDPQSMLQKHAHTHHSQDQFWGGGMQDPNFSKGELFEPHPLYHSTKTLHPSHRLVQKHWF